MQLLQPEETGIRTLRGFGDLLVVIEDALESAGTRN